MRLFGRALCPEDRGTCLLTIEDDRILAIEAAAEPPPGAIGDASTILAPGFIDLQINGVAGVDFSDPAADVATAAAALPRFGVTGFLATLVSLPTDETAACLENLGAAAPPVGAARLLGVHVEGPYLSPAFAGTHDRAALRAPDPAEALGWLRLAPLRLLTIAPELRGALALAAQMRERGVRVAAGHSDATWAEAAQAADAGVVLGTHLFNAMRRFQHRDPGLPGFLLASSLSVSVIADGVHVAPETLRLVARIKAPDELILITDALAGLGLPAGAYRLGGRETRSDGVAARLADGTLSGSTTPMNRAVGNLVAAGVDPAVAVRAATVNPARLLGIESEAGSLAPGLRADVAVLSSDWAVLATVVGGRMAHIGERHQVEAGVAA